MSAKAIVVLCAQALLAQCALSQCTSRAAIAATPGIGYGYDGYGAAYGIGANGLAGAYGLGAAGLGLAGAGLGAPCGWNAPAVDFTPTSGGGLPVSSASPMAPVGISVASENAYEGALAVAGELPFVGTVGLEGVLPTAGAGAVNHACGNGRNAMVSEGAAYSPAYGAAAIAPAAGLAPAAAYAGNAAAFTAPALAAPGLAASGYGYLGGLNGINGLNGLAGRGCGCAL